MASEVIEAWLPLSTWIPSSTALPIVFGFGFKSKLSLLSIIGDSVWQEAWGVLWGLKFFTMYTNFTGVFANWYVEACRYPKGKRDHKHPLWTSLSQLLVPACLGLFSCILLQVCILYLDEMLPISQELPCEFMWFFPLFPHTLGPLMSWTPWTTAATVSLSNSPEGRMRSNSLYHLTTRSLPPAPRFPATAPQLKPAHPRRVLLNWMELLQSVSW